MIRFCPICDVELETECTPYGYYYCLKCPYREVHDNYSVGYEIGGDIICVGEDFNASDKAELAAKIAAMRERIHDAVIVE